MSARLWYVSYPNYRTIICNIHRIPKMTKMSFGSLENKLVLATPDL